MNLIFGCASADGENSVFERLRATVRDLYGQETRAPETRHPAIRLGYIEDGGRVFGCAQDDDLALLYLGAIHLPAPEWDAAQGSPLDDPPRTARYLMERFRRHGKRFLDGALGQYCVALCDRRDGALRIASSQAVFYAHCEGRLAFCSLPFVLARALGEGVSIDRSLEDFLLIHAFLPAGRTIYSSILCAPTDALLEWRDGRLSSSRIERQDPWAQRFGGVDFAGATADEAIDTLYEAFMAAVEETAASAPQAAVMLGGIDSSLVAAGLKRLGKTVETFTFRYENAAFNQPHVEELATSLGANHNWVPVTAATYRAALPDFPKVFAAPNYSPAYVTQTDALCGVIRRHGHLHAYTGDGGDTVFLGTTKSLSFLGRLFPRLRLPPALPRAVAALLDRAVLEATLGRFYRVMLNALRNLEYAPPLRGYISFWLFDRSSLKRLRTGPPPPQERSIEDVLRELTRGLDGLSYERLVAHGRLWRGSSKPRIFGCSLHRGVTLVSPYLHPGLAALAKRMPDEFHRPRGWRRGSEAGKHLLQQMAERKGLLPKAVIYQPKLLGNDAPVDDWYFGPLKQDVMEILNDLPFDFDRRYVDNLLRRKLADQLHRRFLCSDHITTHEVSLLATYALLARACRRD